MIRLKLRVNRRLLERQGESSRLVLRLCTRAYYQYILNVSTENRLLVTKLRTVII